MNTTVSAFYDIYQKESFDPFQVFEITQEPCYLLRVSGLKGENITKGWVGDLVDTPDPYLIVQIKTSPSGKKRTKTLNNNINPMWDDVFEYYLDPKENHTLDVILMEANYVLDETLGTQQYDLSELEMDKDITVTLSFPRASTVTVTLRLFEDLTPNLRFSLALCDEEKAFLQKRRGKVLNALRELLGEELGPQTVREVPVIGVLGSGGGFRAMVCLSGVFKALFDSKVLDCITYVGGLSGSSWYISTLYSHPEFPKKSPGEFQPELKDNINQSPFSLLTVSSLYRYMGSIINKRMSGQPISFTDFFGHLLGDTLLKDDKRKECTLSGQQHVIEDGSMPFPLYTCLHVKKNVTAKVFQEWVEFSPYEVGIAKYGTFMKTATFGSKLYLGRIIKKYDEFPLHFLQGVWGSAFCVLFKQLVQERGRKDLAQLMRENDSEAEEAELDKKLENIMVEDESEKSESEDEDEIFHKKDPHLENGNKRSNGTKPDKKLERGKLTKDQRRESEISLWQGMINNIFTSSWLDSCQGRAGMIHNPLRGVSLVNLYPISPFSPTTPSDDVDFKGSKEALPTDAKKLYLVDSGLTFNSPYPLLLRPQRGVELYLSFDFSARLTDNTPPFKELLLAEKWAKLNDILFPPIEEQARAYSKEPVKECYVFKHPTDPFCPVILHFPIINSNFRTYKSPGQKRETDEEKQFADFDVFDDPDNQYSLYNFNYSPLQFDRMSQLMEFNMLHSLPIIKQAIADTIVRKRNTLPKPPLSLVDITKLKMKFRTKGVTVNGLQRLQAYVRSFSREETRTLSTIEVKKEVSSPSD